MSEWNNDARFYASDVRLWAVHGIHLLLKGVVAVTKKECTFAQSLFSLISLCDRSTFQFPVCDHIVWWVPFHKRSSVSRKLSSVFELEVQRDCSD